MNKNVKTIEDEILNAEDVQNTTDKTVKKPAPVKENVGCTGMCDTCPTPCHF